MLSLLNFLLATLPFKKIARIIINQMRKMALSSDTELDDTFVDIIESIVFALLGNDKAEQEKAKKLVERLKEQ